jgi:hypothetical protein
MITVVSPYASDSFSPLESPELPAPAPSPPSDDTYLKGVDKGQPGGVASLDASGRVPAPQLPPSTAGVSVSTWDAISGKPGAFPPTLHGASHSANGSDPTALSVSQIIDWPLVFPPDASAVQTSSVGLPNGVASLGGDGKVPASQLPVIGSGTGDMLRSVYDANSDGVVDRAAFADVAASISYNNVTGAPGLATTSVSGFCPPFDGTTILVSNGRLSAAGGGGGGGGGSGDMLKSVYDANNDGIVDRAALADAAPYSGITGKPTLGTASALDVASSGDAASGQVVKGADSRLSNARTPASHAATHLSGASDPIAVATSVLAGLCPAVDNVTIQIVASKLTTVALAWTAITGKPSTFAPDATAMLKSDYDSTSGTANRKVANAAVADFATSASWLTLSDKPTLGTAAAKDIPSSGNASVTQVVYGTDTRLSDLRAPAAHAASHKVGGSDAIKIDELGAATDVTTLNASTTAHGLLLKLSGTATQYLNGSGLWSTPAGTGGAGDMSSSDFAAGTGAGNTAHKVDHALYADAAPYSGITGTPTLGTAAAKDIASSGNASSTQVVYGNDTRLSDSRAPAAHETSHITGGSDIIPAATTSASGLVPVLPGTLATSKFHRGDNGWAQVDYSNLTGTPALGTSAAKDVALSGDASSTQVVYGTDSRLSNARTPSAHAASHANGGSDALTLLKAQISDFPTLGTSSALNVAAAGNAASGEVVKGSDTRLSDARTPAAHKNTHITGGSDVILAATTSASGLVPILPATGATAKFLNGASAFTQVAYADVTGTPTLGTSASRDVAPSGNASSTQVVLGNDGRLSDSRPPAAHAASHLSGGSDAISNATATVGGLVPAPPNDATKFYSGVSTFVAVPYTSLSGTPSSFSPSAHEATHITGGSDVIPAPTTSASGLVPSLPGTGATAKFLNGSAAFAQVAYADVTGTPTLGTAAAKDIPSSGNASSTQVVYGNDTRLSDARTPASHAASHASGGADPVTVANTQVTGLGTASTLNAPAAGNAASGEAVKGSDTRLSDSRTPASHAATHLSGGSDPISSASATVSGLVPTPPNDATKVLTGTMTYTAVAYANVTGTPTLGTSAAKDIPGAGNASVAQVVYGTDTRLSDSRTPAAHAASHKSGGSDLIKLDELAATTDVTTLNASTTAHGLLPKLSNVSTQYLDGTGAWSTPAGGGGSSGPPKPFKAWVAGIECFPPSTLYATFGTRNNRPFLAFNDSATWTTYAMTVLPTGITLTSGLIVRLKWMAATATTGSAVCGVAIERMNTDQDADSFDTQATATTACSATSGIAVETAITITTIDSAVAGDGIIIQVQRLGASGSDSLVGDLQLETVSVEAAA